MRCLSLSVSVLALGLISAGIIPQHSVAAPLPAAYSAAAGGDLVAVAVDRTTGTDLPAARTGGRPGQHERRDHPRLDEPTATNVLVNATGLGIALQSNSQTAPPDHTSPDTGTIAAGTATGLFDLALLNTSVQARTEAAVACTPAGGFIAKSEVQTTGAILNPTGLGTIADTGTATTNGTVAIYPRAAERPAQPCCARKRLRNHRHQLLSERGHPGRHRRHVDVAGLCDRRARAGPTPATTPAR